MRTCRAYMHQVEAVERSLLMLWRSGLLIAVLFGSPLLAQDSLPVAPSPVVPTGASGMFATAESASESGRLTGNRDFPNFIGWMSNPMQNIDPRSLTQIWPLFGSTWTGASPPVPDTNFQILGPGLNLALTDRLSFVLNE